MRSGRLVTNATKRGARKFTREVAYRDILNERGMIVSSRDFNIARSMRRRRIWSSVSSASYTLTPVEIPIARQVANTVPRAKSTLGSASADVAARIPKTTNVESKIVFTKYLLNRSEISIVARSRGTEADRMRFLPRTLNAALLFFSSKVLCTVPTSFGVLRGCCCILPGEHSEGSAGIEPSAKRTD